MTRIRFLPAGAGATTLLLVAFFFVSQAPLIKSDCPGETECSCIGEGYVDDSGCRLSYAGFFASQCDVEPYCSEVPCPGGFYCPDEGMTADESQSYACMP